jgi:hypothetical protein
MIFNDKLHSSSGVRPNRHVPWEVGYFLAHLEAFLCKLGVSSETA